MRLSRLSPGGVTQGCFMLASTSSVAVLVTHLLAAPLLWERSDCWERFEN